MSDVAIPDGWKQVRLGDVCTKVGSGSTPTGGKSVYVSTGYPFIRSQNVGYLQFLSDGLAYIADNDARKLRNVTVKPRDVLINITGDSVARCCMAPDFGTDSYVNQHVCIIRTDNALLLSGFLVYLLNSSKVQDLLLTIASSGATRNALTKAHLESLEINCPPLHEQKAIAHILGTLDDKIDQLRKTNTVLEDMASALFKSWFVDFDPVKAKQENRPTGLPKDLDDLFPDSFEDSALGPIPKGWRVAKFCEVSLATRGLSYSGEHLSDTQEGKPLHNLNSIHEGGAYKYSGIKYYRGAYKTQHIVRPGELLVANTEQGFDNLLIGFAAVAPDTFGEEGLFSHHLYKLSFNDTSPIRETYTYYWINNVRNHDAICRFANGTTVNMLPIDALSRSLITVPCKALIDTFDDVSKSSTIGLFEHQIQTLTNLRDTLLPRLISGELRVPDAEQMVAELGL